MKRIIAFIKRESILSISLVLAAASCLIIPPDAKYANYIDIRTISLLFSLMAVMAGFQSLFLFRRIGRALMNKTKNTTELAAVLISLCFFTSMIVTNDVALITFVPFAIELFLICGKKKQLMMTVILQTIAANLGSMLIPPGNPQNLYLYSISGMSISEFILIMLPFTSLSFILLCIALVFIKKESIEISTDKVVYPAIKRSKFIMYIILFIICILAVLKLIPHYWALIAVITCLIIFDRNILKRVDYGLLLTFAALFIFVGNIARIPVIYKAVSSLTGLYPFAVSVGASQIISNVPAALLISGFTDNYTEILKGVNIGGLGTIIASMASLISYKLYMQSSGSENKKYLAIFTLMNVAFLTALCILNIIIR